MGARWYIVHAYSNFEKKVADSIEEQARSKGLDHLFEKILVPGAVENIKRIQIFLADAERAAVVQSKIAKSKARKLRQAAAAAEEIAVP